MSADGIVQDMAKTRTMPIAEGDFRLPGADRDRHLRSYRAQREESERLHCRPLHRRQSGGFQARSARL
jgi:hypothetical protein